MSFATFPYLGFIFPQFLNKVAKFFDLWIFFFFFISQWVEKETFKIKLFCIQ